ncbi:MAG TPA: hypothetical protein VIH90_07100 [Candidatus Saccharimonadales bacterium]
MEEESRYFLAWGKKSPEQWEEAIRLLGSLGFNVSDPSAEEGVDLISDGAERYDGILLDRNDFLAAAAENSELSNQTAGRAWALVTRLYTYKTFKDHFNQYTEFRHFDFEDNPLVFDNRPRVDQILGDIDGFRRKLSGLSVDSLEVLLLQLQAAITAEGKSAVHRLLGDEVGTKTIDYLYGVVAWAKINKAPGNTEEDSPK